MDLILTLGHLTLLVIVITICVELYMVRFRTYLNDKWSLSGRFWTKVKYPEDGEDCAFCDLCHGKIGSEKITVCACGKHFHPECSELENCPNCGNDHRHMLTRTPLMIRCPICLRVAPGGKCEHCDITIPRKNGTFKCTNCGTTVFASDPHCRKCGQKYAARITKGYMSKVRSRR